MSASYPSLLERDFQGVLKLVFLVLYLGFCATVPWRIRIFWGGGFYFLFIYSVSACNPKVMTVNTFFFGF